jgi:Chalcone isomerase-like
MRAVHLTLLLGCLLLPFAPPTWGAEVDGVVLPEVKQVDGRTLQLNGFGQRTATILQIPVYVASLYLEHASRDPEEILRSAEEKVLVLRFQHDVSAAQARNAWRKALMNNCVMPCQLDPADVERFLAGVPAMHEGDNFELCFAGHTAVITANGRPLGHIDKPPLADAVLAAFLGPRPGSPTLKEALLARRL